MLAVRLATGCRGDDLTTRQGECAGSNQESVIKPPRRVVEDQGHRT